MGKSGYDSKPKSDEYMTPPELLDQVLVLVNKDKYEIWEPFVGDGSSTTYMRDRGFTVHNGNHTDFFLQDIPTPSVPGKDIVMLTNPPFSKKKQILLHIIHKLPTLTSFCLLLPNSCLYNKDFKYLLSRVNAGAIFNTRTRFISDGKRCDMSTFSTLWLMLGACFQTFIHPTPTLQDGILHYSPTKQEDDHINRFNCYPMVKRGMNFRIAVQVPDTYNFEKRVAISLKRRQDNKYYPPLDSLLQLVQQTTSSAYLPVPCCHPYVCAYFSSPEYTKTKTATKNTSKAVTFVFLYTESDYELQLFRFLQDWRDTQQRKRGFTYYLAVLTPEMYLSAQMLNYVYNHHKLSASDTTETWVIPIGRIKYVLKETLEVCPASCPFGVYWRIVRL